MKVVVRLGASQSYLWKGKQRIWPYTKIHDTTIIKQKK